MIRGYHSLRGLRGYFSYAGTHAYACTHAHARGRRSEWRKDNPANPRKPASQSVPPPRGRWGNASQWFLPDRKRQPRPAGTAASIDWVCCADRSGFWEAVGRATLGRGRTDAVGATGTSQSPRWPRAAFLGVWGPRGAASRPRRGRVKRPACDAEATGLANALDATNLHMRSAQAGDMEVRREHRTKAIG